MTHELYKAVGRRRKMISNKMQTQEIFSKILIIAVYFQFVLIVLQELRISDKIIGCAGGKQSAMLC